MAVRQHLLVLLGIQPMLCIHISGVAMHHLPTPVTKHGLWCLAACKPKLEAQHMFPILPCMPDCPTAYMLGISFQHFPLLMKWYGNIYAISLQSSRARFTQLSSGRYNLKGVMIPCSWFSWAQRAEIPISFCMFWPHEHFSQELFLTSLLLCAKIRGIDKKQDSWWEVLMGHHHTVPAGLAQPLGSSRSIWFSHFQETPPNSASPAETAPETRHSRFCICLPHMGNKISQKDNEEAVLNVKPLSLVFAIFAVSPAGHRKEDDPLCAARRITEPSTNFVTYFYHYSHSSLSQT